MHTIQYREALNQALDEEMGRDERVFVMGEEVGHYEGAYKVTQGLLKKYGEKRVIDTPIAESGFAGVGIGAALMGLRPVIEFMTWNFSAVAFDQLLNNSTKLRYMSGGQFTVPVVFRGPTGAAHMLGAQHSQQMDHIYAHMPGHHVIVPATPYDAKGLLKAAIRDDNPVCFMEAEVLYGTKGEVPDEEYLIPIGKADVKREGGDVTLITWGKVQFTVLEAAKRLAQDGIEAEVIDLRTVRPMDEEAIYTSVAKTHRAVVVCEGWPLGGIGAEVVYRIQENIFDELDAPIGRVASEDVPMPYNKHMEKRVLPDVKRVIDAVLKVTYT